MAEVLGEANELIPLGGNSSSNNLNSKKMDLWNNRIGRKIGKKTSGKKTSGKKTSGKKTSGKKTSGKKTSGKKNLFKLILKALKNNEFIIDPDSDPRISKIQEIQDSTIKNKIVVIKESKKGKNLSYFDIENKIVLSKQEFVARIRGGNYPRYEIRIVNNKTFLRSYTYASGSSGMVKPPKPESKPTLSIALD